MSDYHPSTGAYNTQWTNAADDWTAVAASFKAASVNPATTLMSNTGPAVSTSRAKYRLSVSPTQPAATYTTIVDYIITATY
jgi:hypothetical protein